MSDALTVYFLVLYGLGIGGFARTVVQARRQAARLDQPLGPPPVPAMAAWLVPPLVLLLRIGEIPAGWPLVRGLGVALSLYSLVMIPWTVRTMGRNLVPGRALHEDHALLTTGPFRWLRHPLYSGTLALWLAAAIGNLNWLLLVLWPLLLAGVLREVPAEERMLRERFGPAYEEYERRTGRFVPGIRAL
jgi:protein-S-isoprenylcysteine O-methyltransferase